MRSHRPKILRIISGILLLILGLGFTLILLEGLSRLIPLWPDKLSDYDPELGFSHIPEAEGWWINFAVPFEFRTRIKINSLGLNDREISVDKPPGFRRILVLGDSYVDGLEVPLEHTFVKQLEGLFDDSGQNIEVINGGHYGYGTDQELLFFLHRGQNFQPDVVVLAFMPGNDIEDNNSIKTIGPKPYFKLLPNGELKLVNFPLDPPKDPDPRNSSLIARMKQGLYSNSKLYRFTGVQIKRNLPALSDFLANIGLLDLGTENEQEGTLADDEESNSGPYDATTSDFQEQGWELTKALILELVREVEESNARLVLLIVPDPRQFGESASAPGLDVKKWNDRLNQFCGAEGLDCLDLYPPFQSLIEEEGMETLFYPLDGHPTADGHSQIAEALFNYLIDKGTLQN